MHAYCQREAKLTMLSLLALSIDQIYHASEGITHFEIIHVHVGCILLKRIVYWRVAKSIEKQSTLEAKLEPTDMSS